MDPAAGSFRPSCASSRAPARPPSHRAAPTAVPGRGCSAIADADAAPADGEKAGRVRTSERLTVPRAAAAGGDPGPKSDERPRNDPAGAGGTPRGGRKPAPGRPRAPRNLALARPLYESKKRPSPVRWAGSAAQPGRPVKWVTVGSAALSCRVGSGAQSS